jgi:hypothetical protein
MKLQPPARDRQIPVVVFDDRAKIGDFLAPDPVRPDDETLIDPAVAKRPGKVDEKAFGAAILAKMHLQQA